MAVEIIRHHTTEELYNLFVSYGGYRILKDWLVDAEKDRYLHFMIAVIKLCRILPFDKAAIKQSEIGKIIKKLTKFESKRQEQLEILRHELDMIMKEWRDKQQIASQLEKEQQQEFKLKEEQDTARKQEKEEIKVHEQLQQQKQSIKIEKKLTHTAVNESKEDDNRMDVVEEEVKPKVEPKRVLSSGSHSRPTPVLSTPIVPTKVPTKSTPLLTALLQNQQSLQQPNAFTSGAAAISAKSNKRTIDMLQGAHELLNQSANRSASPSEPVLAKIDLTVVRCSIFSLSGYASLFIFNVNYDFIPFKIETLGQRGLEKER